MHIRTDDLTGPQVLELLAEHLRHMYEFTPAHRLYESVGFVGCGPFGDSPDDPHSRLFTLALG